MREKIGSKQIENILSRAEAEDALREENVSWDESMRAPHGDVFFHSREEEVAVWVECDHLLIINEAEDKPADIELNQKLHKDDLVDSVVGTYEEMQGEVWFGALSLDSQGEIAVKVAKMIEEKVTEARMEMLKEEMIRVEKQQESLHVTYEYLVKEVERLVEDV